MKKIDHSKIYSDQYAKILTQFIDDQILKALLGLPLQKSRDTSDDWKGYLIDGDYYKPTSWEAQQDQGQEGGDEHVRKLVERRVRGRKEETHK